MIDERKLDRVPIRVYAIAVSQVPYCRLRDFESCAL